MSDQPYGPDAPAHLIERILSDPAFRARFRRDPEGAAREAGLDPGAAAAAQPALETLELRESKSSLAGGLMAAAAEGVGLYELLDHGGLGAAAAEAAVPAPSGAVEHLLHDSNVGLDPDGVADLRSGRIDPRIVAILEQVSRHHRITVSAMMSDHDVHTANGSVSNHHYGRAVDIASVDGRPVGPGNEAAHRLALSLLRLDPRIRPTELGSPWALGDPVTFTDAAHQNHIHVAFDDPIKPGRAPPLPAPDDVADPETDDSSDTDDPDDSSDSSDSSDSDDTSDSSDSDDTDAPDSDDPDSDAPDSDDPDSDAPDVDDPDDDADEEDDDDADEEDDDADEEDDDDEEDEEDDDEEEDEDEPDEDEPDEVGPDADDLSDDERQVDAPDGDDSAPDGADAPDGDDSAPDGDSDDGGGGAPDLGDVDASYPGDDAPRAHVAAWMAAEAQRRGLPAELPVMAALVESGMRNLPGGDADSVGFFQMRAGIWDSGPYAGYGKRPELQLDWFLDHAEQVRGQRLARGLSVRDSSQFGEWIADVERPAEQYRGRYQLRLDEARGLLRSAAELAGGDHPAGPTAHASADEVQVLPVIRPDQITPRPR